MPLPSKPKSTVKNTHLTQITSLLLLAGVLNSKGATGNDTWMGNTSANWVDANWSGANNPPITGDSLFFGPAGASGTALNNNSPATSFAGLTFNYSAAAYSITGSSVTLSGGIVDNSSNPETLNFPLALSATANIGVTAGGVLTLGGVISGATFGLTATGFGTLDLNGSAANTYAGATTANAGTLLLDFSNLGATANLISASSALNLGGGTLQVVGNAANASSQTVNGATVNPGLDVISVGPNGGNPANPLPTLNLGAFTQTAGSQTMFVGPSVSTNYSGGTVTNLVATGTITTTTLGNQNKLLWPTTRQAIATVGLYNWASVVTAGTGAQSILAGDQVSGFYTTVAAGGIAANADLNYDLLGNATFNNSKPAYVDDIRFNVPGAFTATTGVGGSGFVFLIGGILVTPNVGPYNTTFANGGEWIAGAYTSAGNSPIDVYQNNIAGELLINTPFTYYSATTRATCYVKGGPGTVVLIGAGANSGNYGAPYLNGGCTVINNNTQIGRAASAATLYLNGGTLVASNNIALDNSGANVRPVTLLGNGGGLAAEAGYTLTVDGQIGSGATAGPLVIGIPASAANGYVAALLPGTGAGTANTTPVYATGTVALTFPSGTAGNFQYGGTLITGGATLAINSQYALGGGNQGPTIFNGGTLQYTTTLATGAAGTALDISGQPVTLTGNSTIDVNGHAVTYANAIGNNGSGQLTLANSGTAGGLFLNGGSTHMGGTVVNGILGGSGTIAGNVTVNSGGKTQPSVSAGATNTISGNLTYSSGAQANFNLGTTSAGGGNDQVVLSGASSTLTSGGVSVGISCGTKLDLVHDYVLFNLTGGSASIAGALNATPVWLATTPTGAANFQVIQSGNQVRLHYAGTTPPTISSATATPATLVRNQPTLISVTTTANVGTISTVTVNLSAIGGASVVNLYLSGTPNAYTNTIAVPASSPAETTNLVVTATDTAGNNASATIALTVNTTIETWSGLGGGNWSDNADWVSTFAPGLAGDTLVFAGTTGLTSTMNNSYSVTGLTFTNGAGSFNIGTSGGTLTVTASGVANNSASPQTLNVPLVFTNTAQTLAATAGSLTLGQGVSNSGNLLTVADGGFSTTVAGPITGGGGLAMTGTGTLTLAGTNTYAGNTLVSGGAVLVSGLISNGAASTATVIINSSLTVNATGGIITGSGATTSGLIVGGTTGNAFLNIAGGAVDINANFNPNSAVGNVSGGNGFLSLTGGSLDCSEGEFHIGQAAGAYGAFDFSSGTITVGDVNAGDAFFVVGAGGEGVLNMTGGTIVDNAQEFSIANTAGGTGVANVSGGTLNDSKGLHVGDRGTATLNVSGSAAVNLTGGTLQFGLSGNTTTGTANLLGGTVTANNVAPAGTTTSRLNFNGGTLAAGAPSATFLQGLTAATVYSGGAIINDGGNAITIAQPLLAPVGNGVSTIPVATGGAGYIDTPVVSISGGGGVGASAVANVASGAVTGITILSPGTGYTTAPTVTLFGGGYTTAAMLGTATLAADISGGLTKQGTGTLTLTGTDTYTNLTTVAAGTLSLQTAPTATAGYVVTNGATLDVSPLGTLTLSAGQSLSGSGTNNGSFATSPGVNIYPGTIGTVATLTFNNDLDLSGGGTLYFDVTNSASGADDQIVVGGTLTVNGGVFHVHALAGTSPLDTMADYVLVTNLSSPNIASLPALLWDGTKPVNAANYSLQLAGNNLVLHYAPLAGPLVATVTLNPATASRGQSVKISATVTPGSGAIDPNAGVTVNLSAFGGSATASLVPSNANVYTNTFVVPTSTSPGGQLLAVTATDANSLSASGGATLNVIATTEIWNGQGAGNWSDNADWVSTLAPGLTGDTLVFAGTTGLTPSMDNNYSVTSVTFASGAGSFNIGTPGGHPHYYGWRRHQRFRECGKPQRAGHPGCGAPNLECRERRLDLGTESG